MSDGFLSRWSRRKAGKVDETVEKADPAQAPTPALPLEDAELPPPVTLEDVEKIDRFDPDFSAFMKPDVDPAVQQAALKKMFTDPHFNVMDGLDIYIDDYSKPDPLPPGMLERMVQSDMLNLFRKSAEAEGVDAGKEATQAQKLRSDDDLAKTPEQSALTSTQQEPAPQLDDTPVESEPKKS
jgi:hypothetical protein